MHRTRNPTGAKERQRQRAYYKRCMFKLFYDVITGAIERHSPFLQTQFNDRIHVMFMTFNFLPCVSHVLMRLLSLCIVFYMYVRGLHQRRQRDMRSLPVRVSDATMSTEHHHRRQQSLFYYFFPKEHVNNVGMALFSSVHSAALVPKDTLTYHFSIVVRAIIAFDLGGDSKTLGGFDG